MKTEARWWETLPEDFCRRAHITEADHRHAFKVKSTAAIDTASRLALASAVMVAMAPNLFSRKKVRHDLKNMEFYKGCADRSDPAEAFPAPPRQVKVTRRPLILKRF